MSANPVFLRAAIDSANVAELSKVVLPLIASELHCDFLAVVRSDKGEWILDSFSGLKKTLPVELLAEALDRGRVTVSGTWLASTIPQHSDLLLVGQRWREFFARDAVQQLLR